MAEANPGHYESFQSLVSRDVFDGEPIGSYMGDISERARHMVAPIDGNSGESFGAAPEEFEDYVNGYVRRAGEHDKVLLLEELVGVEDDISVVFIENHPELKRTVKVTSYRDEDESVGNIAYGILTLQLSNRKFSGFLFEDLYVAFIVNGEVEPVTDAKDLDYAKIDLFNATNAVIDQLALMDMQGMLGEIRRIT